ncbi:MAG: translation initiation factor IF-3 [Candidatus Nealsonbacteria bacterium]|nr:translation initiation factor IF-3 [Candidatus Nealsonbacteria bacterium]
MQKPLVNRQIRAKEVRLIDETGKQVGVVALEQAIQMALDSGLDLIQVTEMVEPPVCKIMDFGKYLYQQRKKEKGAKTGGSEIKGVRLGFNMASHDLEVRAHQAEKFLKEGDAVRIEMRLKGREKALGDFAKEKINKFLEQLQNLMPYKIERELKRDPRGFSMIIAKK